MANAIGAAIAQVGGEVDRVFASRDDARRRLDREARGVRPGDAAGARQDPVEIVDVEEVPLAYLPGNATRIRVKAVGDLAMRQTSDLTFASRLRTRHHANGIIKRTTSKYQAPVELWI